MTDTKKTNAEIAIEWLKQFDNEQRKQIMLGLDFGVDVRLYASPYFDDLQMKQILLGQMNGVDTSIYAKSEFDWLQMREIRQGLENGEEVSLYAKIEFNWGQMFEIRAGQRNGVDVSLYANQDFSGGQMEQIRLGQQNGIDVLLYLDPKISWEEMKEMRKKLEKEKQEQDSKIANEPLDDGKPYRIQLGDYYIGLSKPDNKIHMGYNSEDNKYYQRIFTLPQIYQLDPRLLPLAVEVEQ